MKMVHFIEADLKFIAYNRGGKKIIKQRKGLGKEKPMQMPQN